ncbi:hypothetical protein KQI42_10810 [Tissierella sp. MSJ-40]|uniref:Uncharacterized protein n=1 Tax=Tissierella simiarum TaxID=2841534 RepID=A0ABS6E8E3_9FIRM|nr:hypothetical protein [Tissierella simiarum]MBU5438503.1 hypothetical protein [Tissierella simiarum]
MYNSVVVSIFVKLWRIMVLGYNHSIIKRVVDFISGGIKHLSKGSNVVSFFTSNKRITEESVFYKIYASIIKTVNNGFKKVNNYIKSIGDNSLIYRNVYKLFSKDVEAIRTSCVFIFSFGIGLLINNLVRGFYAGKSYIVAFFLIIVSIIGLTLKENYKEVLSNSWLFKFIESIFTIDEGGTNWW